MSTVPATMRQLRSLVTPDGRLELSIARMETPVPADHEVLVRMEAAPINPSDLGALLAFADLAQATNTGVGDDIVLSAPISAGALPGLVARVGESLAVGNEGCGVVVAAGANEDAQRLLGRTVSIIGGATYGEYRAVPTMSCLELPDGTSFADGASCFVNPLTALAMVEVMRDEGHRALVHTAAASNLGQMLNRICIADGVPLVNVVRRPEQAELLRRHGATYVCESTSPTFRDDLTSALVSTGATIAFDAIGGGDVGSQILACMEAAANANAVGYQRYGSSVHKQLYIYGSLDRGPTVLHRSYGMAWSAAGWLLTPFLQRIGLAGLQRLRERVVSELTTTFASHYTAEVGLSGMIEVGNARVYARQATGEKFLVKPAAG